MPTIEELQEQLLQEQEARKNVEMEIAQLKEKDASLEDENKKLKDYNQRLFARVSEPVNEEEDDPSPEDEEQAYIDDVIKLMEERG